MSKPSKALDEMPPAVRALLRELGANLTWAAQAPTCLAAWARCPNGRTLRRSMT